MNDARGKFGDSNYADSGRAERRATRCRVMIAHFREAFPDRKSWLTVGVHESATVREIS